MSEQAVKHETSEQPILEAIGITKHFGSLQAVKDLSLQINRGDVYGFIGPNGAGKTTSIRMMLGLISPTSGSARIFGHDIRHNFLRAIKHVGALVEGPAFYPYLSGEKNLKLYGGLSGGISKERIAEVLQMVGLARRGKHKVKGYSQGMRQRLGIAQALLHRPDILILDEPTNGLDPQGMREVRNLIRRISREDGTTIMLSSHLLGEMEMICNRIGVMYRGNIIMEGYVDELLGKSADMVSIQTNNEEKAVQLLSSKFEIDAQIPKQGWIEFPRSEVAMALINRTLVQEGFEVSSISARHKNLEEYFVELTGESQDVH